LIVGEDKQLRLFDLTTYKEVKAISTESSSKAAADASHNQNTTLAVNPSGHFVAAANTDKRVRMFNVNSRKRYFEVGVGEKVSGIHFTPD
jgi:WD40 repeat protein